MKFSEKHTVQKPLLKYAQQLGWQFVDSDTALELRNGETGLFFYQQLKDQLVKLNPEILDFEAAEEVVKRLGNQRPNIEGNFEVLKFIRGQQTYYSKKEKREFNIKFIDFDTPSNNVFQITEEFRFTNGNYNNRPDVVFLINGIPLVIVELKRASLMEGIEHGLEQLKRYHLESPELMVNAQLFDISNGSKLSYGVTWGLKSKNVFAWKDEERGDFELKIKTFFDLSNILSFLNDFIVFSYQNDELIKMILRQHQTRAVNKVVERAKDKKKARGLVWHTQGSGKTMTMIVAAQKLMEHPAFEKPTVLMIIDRNELQDQLIKNIESCGIKNVEKANTKAKLQELLASDYRGIIVSMIHKFDKVPAKLSERSNIFVLVDEAHRTTSGDLGSYLMGAIPNATLFGFTGTPIDKTAYGKGTFKVFGVDDEDGYLDKYSIAESIADSTTVALNYSLAPNEFQVPKEILEQEFFALKEAEGMSDLEELDKILRKAVNTRNFLKSEERVDKLARYVADHYKTNVEPLGYKAFLIGVDREACVYLKKALDKYLPPEWSEVVYTSAHNDPPLLKEFYLDSDKEKQLRKDFPRAETLPKILIVTEKLLTGFDAPVLYAMYLDKPLRDHTLLQAIARVNRPYEDKNGKKKPCGLIFDFVGLFKNLEKALSFDSDTVQNVVKDIDLLKQKFATLLKQEAKIYLDLVKGLKADKITQSVITYFIDIERRKTFKAFFKEVETLYEIISPDAFLTTFINDYGTLAEILQTINNEFVEKTYLDSDFMQKTSELVRKQIGVEGLNHQLPFYEINELTLAKLKEKNESDEVKVINLTKSLKAYVERNVDKEKYLISIGEKVEDVMKRFEKQQLSTQQALKLLEESIEDINDSNKEKTEKGFDDDTFMIYSLLGKYSVVNREEVARELRALFQKYPNWKVNAEQRRLIRKEAYKPVLRVISNPDDVLDFVDILFDRS